MLIIIRIERDRIENMSLLISIKLIILIMFSLVLLGVIFMNRILKSLIIEIIIIITHINRVRFKMKVIFGVLENIVGTKFIMLIINTEIKIGFTIFIMDLFVLVW